MRPFVFLTVLTLGVAIFFFTYKTSLADGDLLISEKISDSMAEEYVSSLPEVKDFLLRMELVNQKTFVRAEKTSGGNWLVQVAELHTDHFATFNWYCLDSQTKKTLWSFFVHSKGQRAKLSTQEICQ